MVTTVSSPQDISDPNIFPYGTVNKIYFILMIFSTLINFLQASKFDRNGGTTTFHRNLKRILKKHTMLNQNFSRFPMSVGFEV